MTIVKQEARYQARVRVTRHVAATINPNGRGYEEDNVTKRVDSEVLDVTLQAKTPQDLIDKVATVMGTIEADE